MTIKDNIYRVKVEFETYLAKGGCLDKIPSGDLFDVRDITNPIIKIEDWGEVNSQGDKLYRVQYAFDKTGAVLSKLHPMWINVWLNIDFSKTQYVAN